MQPAHFRVARPAQDLDETCRLYVDGLGFALITRFGHEGCGGIVIGHPDLPWHLEFTVDRESPVAPTPNAEDLLVFYLPDEDAWETAVARALAGGWQEVQPHNGYWARRGRTFQDRDGYLVVLQNTAWPPDWETTPPFPR